MLRTAFTMHVAGATLQVRYSAHGSHSYDSMHPAWLCRWPPVTYIRARRPLSGISATMSRTRATRC